jgi:hypothetical protein
MCTDGAMFHLLQVILVLEDDSFARQVTLSERKMPLVLCLPYDLVHMTLCDRQYILCIWSFPYDQHVTRSYHFTISRVTHFILLHYSWPIRIGFKLSLSLLPPPVYWNFHDSLIGYLSELPFSQEGALRLHLLNHFRIITFVYCTLVFAITRNLPENRRLNLHRFTAPFTVDTCSINFHLDTFKIFSL